jgi:hypothetical protein
MADRHPDELADLVGARFFDPLSSWTPVRGASKYSST